VVEVGWAVVVVVVACEQRGRRGEAEAGWRRGASGSLYKFERVRVVRGRVRVREVGGQLRVQLAWCEQTV